MIITVLLCILIVELVYMLNFYKIQNLIFLDYFLSSIMFKVDDFFIEVYFKTLIIFCFINLFLSIFGINNFINFHNNYTTMYFFTIIHTLLCILYGIYKIGIRNMFNNFYVVKPDSVINFIIGNFIFLLLIFVDLVVKPIVISTRLVLNVFVAEKLHHAISIMPCSIFLIVFLNCFKILMYCLQSYLFYIFMFSIYKHTCTKNNH